MKKVILIAVFIASCSGVPKKNVSSEFVRTSIIIRGYERIKNSRFNVETNLKLGYNKEVLIAEVQENTNGELKAIKYSVIATEFNNVIRYELIKTTDNLKKENLKTLNIENKKQSRGSFEVNGFYVEFKIL